MKYNTWNFIAFTFDYKSDGEVGNSVWYFANEDDGWAGANISYLALDPDATSNLSYSGAWESDRGRGIGLQNIEDADARGENAGASLAAPGYYAEFRYYDTLLSQSSVKKLYDFPFGVEDTSKNFLQTIRSRAVADGEIISFYADEGGSFIRGASHPTANFGDIWIDTSDYNANLTHGGLTTNAINRYQNTSFGVYPSEGTLVWEATPYSAIGKVYLDAAAARNVADQKTVTYYAANVDSIWGPNVAVTPTGTMNPNPESDLWIDTGTNRLYIYKTNSSFSPTYVDGDGSANVWANTIHSGTFSPTAFSGWWDVQDTVIAATANLSLYNEWASANALVHAATAQAAADREIVAFFAPEPGSIGVDMSIPNATGNGDVWIHTTGPIDSDGTTNLNAIFAANTFANGASYIDQGVPYSNNYAPSILTFWDGNPSDYEILDVGRHFNSSADDTSPKPYRIDVTIPGPPGSGLTYNTAHGISSTDGVAGAANTTRVEFVTDIPGPRDGAN